MSIQDVIAADTSANLKILNKAFSADTAKQSVTAIVNVAVTVTVSITVTVSSNALAFLYLYRAVANPGESAPEPCGSPLCCCTRTSQKPILINQDNIQRKAMVSKYHGAFSTHS